jgi:hypothetical protein
MVFLHGGLGFYHGSRATWSQLLQRYTREAGNVPIEGKFAKCFICLPQTVHSRGGILAAGSLFVNMNQATRFKAAPRATSGILGSHTETNRPRHSRVILNHQKLWDPRLGDNRVTCCPAQKLVGHDFSRSINSAADDPLARTGSLFRATFQSFLKRNFLKHINVIPCVQMDAQK